MTAATLNSIPPKGTPAPREFRFRGNNLAALRDYTSREWLLDGAAGTGKTSALLFCFWRALTDHRYHGVRCLLLRKTRRSLTESGLVTWERDILGPNLPKFGKARREQRSAYHFANGGELAIGGLDDVGRIMSSDYDLIGVLEATEAEEDEIEMLTTRLRNGRYPAQTLMLDCNPSYPTHWLNQRCLNGRCLRYKSYHHDNPALYDLAASKWTERGKSYMEILDKLSGPRRKRLKDGQWVQAEGVIYPEWNPELHLKDSIGETGKRTPPADWPVYVGIDFGYSALHPFVALWLAQDPYGSLWVYRELHESGRLVEDFAREIKALCEADGNAPRKFICDHDAEGRATLERYLERSMTPAVKETLPSIQAVQARLRPDDKGEPRLYVLRDSLIRRDPKIAELKRPCSLESEMDSWIWEDNDKKDVPVKDSDDACFVAGTMIETADGQRPIESLRPGDKVRTHLGCGFVLAASPTGIRSIFQVTFDDGRRIMCSGEHPVGVHAGSFIPASELAGLMVDVAEGWLCWQDHTQREAADWPSVSSGAATSGAGTWRAATPGSISADSSAEAESSRPIGFTRKFGSQRMGRSLAASSFITKTGTRPTTPLRIWNSRPQPSTAKIIPNHWRMLELLPPSGTVARPESNGIGSMVALRGTGERSVGLLASSAGARTGLVSHRELITARSSAERRPVGSVVTITSAANASSAAPPSPLTVIRRRGAARKAVRPVGVGCVVALGIRRPVFNLSTSDGTYFANGVLVSNCDALRYVVYFLDRRYAKGFRLERF